MGYESPLVSVIIPVYKVENYLHQCIRSVLCQTHFNLEIILVDDESPDACPQICNNYASLDYRVHVIHKRNEGPAIARKSGLAAASGEYIMFIDSDDWIELDTIEQCVKVALRDDADCIMFGYIREYPERSIANPLFDQEFSYDYVDSEDKIHRRLVGFVEEELSHPERIDNLSSMCMKLFRSEAARRGLIISDRIVGTSEDTLFNLYALDNCRISYINQCFYHYRKTNVQSITTHHKMDLAEKWDVMYQVFREYIDSSERSAEYWPVFLNRVACGMIGLGLNEVSGSDSFWKKAQRLRRILHKPLYLEAFAQLNISYSPLKWKVFFLLCKCKAALSLEVLLEIINFLRSRMTA